MPPCNFMKCHMFLFWHCLKLNLTDGIGSLVVSLMVWYPYSLSIEGKGTESDSEEKEYQWVFPSILLLRSWESFLKISLFVGRNNFPIFSLYLCT